MTDAPAPAPSPPPLQVSSSYPFIRPVLQCLQDMVSVPLAAELVQGRAPAPLDYLQQGQVTQVRGRGEGGREGEH